MIWLWRILGIISVLVVLLILGVFRFIYSIFVGRNPYLGLDGMETLCSNPCNIAIDPNKLVRVDEYFKGREQSVKGIQKAVTLADGRPAIVVCASPLIVAAHSDEMDAIVFLDFSHLENVQAKVGQRLLCAMGYFWLPKKRAHRIIPADLIEGVNSTSKFDNIMPIIVDFITSDRTTLQSLKASIPDADWRYLAEMAPEQFSMNLSPSRDGRPSLCHVPTKGRFKWGLRMTIGALLRI